MLTGEVEVKGASMTLTAKGWVIFLREAIHPRPRLHLTSRNYRCKLPTGLGPSMKPKFVLSCLGFECSIRVENIQNDYQEVKDVLN